MSHLLFFLALAFVAWRWFAKLQGGAKDIRPEGGQAASRRSNEDADGDEIADVAKAVSSFLGEKGFLGEAGLLGEKGLLGETGRELLGQAVSHALQQSGVAGEIERRAADVIKPIRQAKQAAKKTTAQQQGKQRAKYLLDGDGGFRQRTDRTARLEQSFRGKGLCSPR
ncbi:hypothetical protein DPM33_27105 [Mesorhizobium hawassense]|uniref:Uncharacterized protein n=1 Tax=Mesorhizobium hawassense TaxID=1209954 RepID=A0A330HQR0_9HYPH|nr:hypothetical protein [Mesorhizobium hawassense]RAZ87007.1 hypothetical protein DPM33_27105 [Mesorhizobium hawassense]